jgi:hypothetical protein
MGAGRVPRADTPARLRVADASMPRLPARRAIPWLALLEILRAGKAHWDELDPADRRRLVELLRKSKGRAGNLTTRERRELREMAGRLQLLRFGRSAAAAAVMGQRRSRARGR